jgi:hypothetical protein
MALIKRDSLRGELTDDPNQMNHSIARVTRPQTRVRVENVPTNDVVRTWRTNFVFATLSNEKSNVVSLVLDVLAHPATNVAGAPGD